jgi:hypothetical protein
VRDAHRAFAKHITDVGAARDRTRRTVPFGFVVQSLVIVWYYLAGHSPRVVTDRRNQARWYVTIRLAWSDAAV